MAVVLVVVGLVEGEEVVVVEGVLEPPPGRFGGGA